MAASVPNVAVVGAGVAGLACAHALHEQGVPVTVFDKARGPGGRISTRRVHEWRFDHGAQYFTFRESTVFGHHVDLWLEAGVVERWQGRIAVIGEQGPGSVRPADSETRYVGVGGMSAIARYFASDVDVRHGVRVVTRWRVGDGWRLEAEDGTDLGVFGAVVVAVPAPQAVPLLAGSTIEQAALDVSMDPCWAVMAGFGEALYLDFDGAFAHNSPLSWIARNTSKPGWPPTESWVMHASAAWSHANLEQSPDEAVARLLDAFGEILGRRLPAPQVATGHRWRFAAPTRPLGIRCLADDDLMLFACGDWCLGGRIEGAFMSGLAVASAILGHARG